METAKIQTIAPDLLNQHLAGLSEILTATVLDGASVGFILPHDDGKSRAFWTGSVFPEVEKGNRRLLIASLDGRAVGTVQLITGLPENQPHRAEIAKLLVHPDFRRRGLARQLMQAAEKDARTLAKTLLTLDTRTGDSAEPLYASLGFSVAGVIPDYCRAPEENRLEATTYMYKKLV
ncbi:GNAT family N-acetyltransferase [Aestuariispira insulae]|uniref:Acetyltransferase (GNAT) family protein n=1 Tax=Aestuariispira insulae TaxID=1461337 RepID=A0A3D9HIH1_9PROT|nr:GNAT family N-acetyltransferase [Aestuariispira insulae]RED49234.1 acetyltransferase (GNAT) family protein [Aestuariispira insulae]